jgi:hypothetical protein
MGDWLNIQEETKLNASKEQSDEFYAKMSGDQTGKFC